MVLARVPRCSQQSSQLTCLSPLPSSIAQHPQIFPAHEGTEMGIGDATLIKALAEATGSSEAVIKDKYKSEGDLGVVAMTSRSTQRTMFQPAPLTLRGVFEEFRNIGTRPLNLHGIFVSRVARCISFASSLCGAPGALEP